MPYYRTRKAIWLLCAFSMAILLGSSLESRAQTLVVPNFSGRGRPAKKSAGQAWKAITRALKGRGTTLVAQKSYYQRARRMRIRTAHAFRPKSIQKVCAKLNLDGVLLGNVKGTRRKMVLNVVLYGSDGKARFKEQYPLRKGAFPKAKADELAARVLDEIGGHPVAEAPKEPEKAPETKPAPEPEKTEASSTADDKFLPPWARNKKKPEETAKAPEVSASSSSSESKVSAEVKSDAPKAEPGTRACSIDDALVAVGSSFHYRAGLSPRHEASLFPGIRVDGRLFLGTFLDVPGVRDIGIGGMFDMGLGLEYGYRNSNTTWGASQMQWRAELMYRLALDVPTYPTFMIRAGYGATSCVIDGDAASVLDASYMAPYAALDIYLSPYAPYLRLFVSGGFLFLVSPGEDLNGSGLGFNVLAGIDVDLFDMVHVGIGYDLTEYLMEADGGGDYSDMFQSFFIRVGYNYH